MEKELEEHNIKVSVDKATLDRIWSDKKYFRRYVLALGLLKQLFNDLDRIDYLLKCEDALDKACTKIVNLYQEGKFGKRQKWDVEDWKEWLMKDE